MAIPGQKTFLQMQEEISEEILDVSIATTETRPTLTRLKQIINDRYRMIITAWSWWWMYRESSFNLVVNQQTPYYIGNQYDEVQWMAIPSLQRRINWMSMTDWETMYPGRYTQYGNATPFNYIPGPPDTDNGLGYFVFPAANAILNVTFGAKLRVSDMSADGDYPVIPADWQDLILNGAKMDVLKFFGTNSADPRYKNYQDMYNTRLQMAILEDQRTEENVWRFRDARSERAMSGAVDYRNGVWITDGNITGF